MDKYKQYAPAVLRIGIALLMLWFGLTNIFQPDVLVGYLPQWATSLIPLNSITFMVVNGVVEVILGIALLIGLFTRISAFIVAVHILVIAIGVGYGDIAVRDYALAIASAALCLQGPDKWCLDFKNKRLL